MGRTSVRPFSIANNVKRPILTFPVALVFALAISALFHFMLLFLMARYDRVTASTIGLSGMVLRADLVNLAALSKVDNVAAQESKLTEPQASGSGNTGDVAKTSESGQRSSSPWRRSYASRESAYGLMAVPKHQAQQSAERIFLGREAFRSDGFQSLLSIISHVHVHGICHITLFRGATSEITCTVPEDKVALNKQISAYIDQKGYELEVESLGIDIRPGAPMRLMY